MCQIRRPCSISRCPWPVQRPPAHIAFLGVLLSVRIEIHSLYISSPSAFPKGVLAALMIAVVLHLLMGAFAYALLRHLLAW